MLVGDCAALGERHTEGGELLGQPADADAELEPAATEVVERVHLAGPQQRVAQRHERDGGADAQRRRGQRQRLARQQRVEQRRALGRPGSCGGDAEPGSGGYGYTES